MSLYIAGTVSDCLSFPMKSCCMQIHTPDSSRYWLADSYAQRHAAGQEPMSVDKEFLRLWFRDHCDPYADEVSVMLCTHVDVQPCTRSAECREWLPSNMGGTRPTT